MTGGLSLWWWVTAAAMPAQDTGWYEVLVLHECAIVTATYCCSDPIVSPVRPVMLRGCPCDTGELFSPDRNENGPMAGFGGDCNNNYCCSDGNFSAQFTLPPGTYFYGIPTATVCAGTGLGCTVDADCDAGTWCTRANSRYKGQLMVRPCVPGACCGAPADPDAVFCSDEIDFFTCRDERRYCASTGTACATDSDCPEGVRCVDGVFLHDTGVPACDGNPCVLGACCIGPGNCLDNNGGGITLANCAIEGGTYFGGVRCGNQVCPVCPIETQEFCQTATTGQFMLPADRLRGERRADDFRPAGERINRICFFPCFIGFTGIQFQGFQCAAEGDTPPDDYILKVYEDEFGLPGPLVPGIPSGGLSLTIDSKADSIFSPGGGSYCWRYSAPILPPTGLKVNPGECYWLEMTGLGEEQEEGTCHVHLISSADGNNYSMYDDDQLYEYADFDKNDLAFCLDSGLIGASNPPFSQDGGCGNFPVACCKPDGSDANSLPDCVDGGTYTQCVGTNQAPVVGIPFPFLSCSELASFGECPQPPNDLCQNAIYPIECQNQLPLGNPGTCTLSGGAPNISEACNVDNANPAEGGCVNVFAAECIPLPPFQDAYHCRFETDSVLATTDGPNMNGAGASCQSGVNSFQADIWYRYISPCDGYMSVVNCGFPRFDSMVQVFGNHTPTCTPCPIANNSQTLACSDDNCSSTGDSASGLRVNNVKAGACYMIRFGGWSQTGSPATAAQGRAGLDIGVVCNPVYPTNPPASAPAPHDRPRNRYISFAPNNAGFNVAFRVQKTTAPTGSCWVQTPVQTGINQYTATCGPTPVFRFWNEPVVHVGDCEIIPVADYSMFVYGPEENPTPLLTSTIDLPSINSKLWGDMVGGNNGVEWTPPDGLSNVNDILAVLAFISAASIRPHFTVVNLQAISSGDPCLNALVNTADVLIAVRAVSGDSYGPPSSGKTIDPAQCPTCP